MANATSKVPAATTRFGDDKIERGLEAVATIYYPGAMIALWGKGGTSPGYATKCDDTAGKVFDGINADSDRIQVFSSDAAGDRVVKVQRPMAFEMAIAAAALGDEGKPVYAVDDSHVGYSSTNLIFVGWVDQVLSATLVRVRPWWMGSAVATAAGGQLAFPKNLLDAGDFFVNPWQRGTSFTSISNTLTYTADRFFAVGGASSSISVSQTAADNLIEGFSKHLKFQRASANSDTTALTLGQVIESKDSVRAQGQQVTLSFWAKTGANYSGGPLTVQLNHSTTAGDDTAAHLVAGSTNWQAVPTLINTTQTLSGTWTRYSFTGLVPATATQLGLLLSWTPAGTAGVDDSIQFDGVQLEIGGVATNFEHQDVQIVLEICQRYFYQINEPGSGVIVGTGSVSASNTELFYLALPVQMRVAPTVTVTVGTFKSNSATAGVVAATGLTGNATHTVNAIGLTSTGTGTAGQAAMLQGGGGAGVIAVSAEF